MEELKKKIEALNANEYHSPSELYAVMAELLLEELGLETEPVYPPGSENRCPCCRTMVWKVKAKA